MTNPAKYKWICEQDKHVYAGDVASNEYCVKCGHKRAVAGEMKVVGKSKESHDGRPVAGRLESSVESGDGFGGILLGVGNWSDMFPLGASGGSTGSDITG